MTQTADKVHLKGIVRSDLGSGRVGRLRKAGWIPGVVYGQREESVSIQINQREFIRLLGKITGESVLVNLELADAEGKPGKENPVLIKLLQHHPVTQEVIHDDFHHVDLTKKVTVDVPISIKGEAIGVKQQGGILDHLKWEVEVECLPTEIPAELEVNVEELYMNDSFHAGQIVLPQGVVLITDPEQAIAACVPPRVEEEVEAEEESDQPEVLKQKSPEEVAVEQAEAKQKKAEGKKEEADHKAEKKEEK